MEKHSELWCSHIDFELLLGQHSKIKSNRMDTSDVRILLRYCEIDKHQSGDHLQKSEQKEESYNLVRLTIAFQESGIGPVK